MKQSRLDDNASIYERRNEKSERQKLSEMNGNCLLYTSDAADEEFAV